MHIPGLMEPFIFPLPTSRGDTLHPGVPAEDTLPGPERVGGEGIIINHSVNQ